MIVSWFPYIRDGYGSEKFYRLKTTALLPLAAAALWSDWLTYLIRSLLALLLYGLFLAASRLRGRQSGGNRTRLIYQAWLIILLLPGSYPWYLAWIFPAIGLGLNLLWDDDRRLAPINSPAIILGLWLAIYSQPSTASGGPWLWPAWSGVPPFLEAVPPAASAAAAWLLLGRYFKFRIQLSFVLLAFFLSGLALYNPTMLSIPEPRALSAILIAGTFLVPDEPASPKNLGTQLAYGALAAVIFFLFLRRGWHYQAMIFSALIPSLISPWIDAFAIYGGKVWEISRDR